MIIAKLKGWFIEVKNVLIRFYEYKAVRFEQGYELLWALRARRVPRFIKGVFGARGVHPYYATCIKVLLPSA